MNESYNNLDLSVNESFTGLNTSNLITIEKNCNTENNLDKILNNNLNNLNALNRGNNTNMNLNIDVNINKIQDNLINNLGNSNSSGKKNNLGIINEHSIEENELDTDRFSENVEEKLSKYNQTVFHNDIKTKSVINPNLIDESQKDYKRFINENPNQQQNRIDIIMKNKKIDTNLDSISNRLSARNSVKNKNQENLDLKNKSEISENNNENNYYKAQISNRESTNNNIMDNLLKKHGVKVDENTLEVTQLNQESKDIENIRKSYIKHKESDLPTLQRELKSNQEINYENNFDYLDYPRKHRTSMGSNSRLDNYDPISKKVGMILESNNHKLEKLENIEFDCEKRNTCMQQNLKTDVHSNNIDHNRKTAYNMIKDNNVDSGKPKEKYNRNSGFMHRNDINSCNIENKGKIFKIKINFFDKFFR